MTTYYLAGSYAARDQLIAYREQLVAADIPVTATWLNEDLDSADLRTWALVDLMDIDGADGLILFTDVPSTSGGMWTELGYALGKGKWVIVVGRGGNLFSQLVREWYVNVDDLLAALTARETVTA